MRSCDNHGTVTDMVRLGSWPETVILATVTYDDGQACRARFSQSAYVDDDGSSGPVVVVIDPFGPRPIQTMVDGAVVSRCGGKLSSRFVRRFYGEGE